MKKRTNIILGAVLAVVCMVSMSIPALAEENPGVSIPVSISLSGTLPDPAEAFTVSLKADDASYPMPEGSDGGVCTMTITGADTKNLPTVTYDRVGIYTYTIYQTAGSNAKCTYDDTVYTLTVYITNAEDGDGLDATAVLYPDTEGDKQPCAGFENVYETVKPVDPKTGDDSSPVLYAVLIAASIGVIAALFLTRKSGKTEK